MQADMDVMPRRGKRILFDTAADDGDHEEAEFLRTVSEARSSGLEQRLKEALGELGNVTLARERLEAELAAARRHIQEVEKAAEAATRRVADLEEERDIQCLLGEESGPVKADDDLKRALERIAILEEERDARDLLNGVDDDDDISSVNVARDDAGAIRALRSFGARVNDSIADRIDNRDTESLPFIAMAREWAAKLRRAGPLHPSDTQMIESIASLFDQTMTSFGEEYVALETRFNQLATKHRELISHHRRLAECNEALSENHEKLIAHAKETDELFNAATMTIEAQKADIAALAADMDGAEKTFALMKEQIEHWKNVRTSEESEKAAAYESRYAAVNKSLKLMTNMMEKFRGDREMFRTRAVLTSSRADGLYVRVKALQEEVVHLQEQLIDARKKIPRPFALIHIEETEKRVNAEIAAARSRMQLENGIDADKCRDCAIMCIAYRHAQSELDTANMRISAMQRRHSDANAARDQEAAEKLRAGLHEADARTKEALLRDASRKAELETAKQENARLVAAMETSRVAQERLNAARRKELDDRTAELAAERASTRSRGDIMACGRLALRVLYFMVSSLDQRKRLPPTEAGIVTEFINTVTQLTSAQPEGGIDSLAPAYATLSEIMCRVDHGTRSYLFRRAVDQLLASHVQPSPSLLSSPPTATQSTDQGELARRVITQIMPAIVSMCSNAALTCVWRDPAERELMLGTAGSLREETERGDLEGALNVLASPIGHPSAPFFQWITEQAIGCMAVSDHFANAMRSSLYAARKSRDDAVLANQQMLCTIEERVKQLIQVVGNPSGDPESGLHVLLRREAAMFTALDKAVTDSAAGVGAAIASAEVSADAKKGMNALQVAWGFVRSLCTRAMHG